MQEQTDRTRWISLYVLCMGFLMIVLDGTVVNVALPSIQDDLDFSASSLAWVVNGYLIAFGGFLLLAGRLGDLIGRKTLFLSGLGIFTVASVICGLAPAQEVLVGARFVQGLGGAVTSAVILGMIVTMFPEPAEQAKAIGVYGFVASAGASVGLLAGGVITQLISWHWIFFINVPIGVFTAVAAHRLIERDEGIGLDKGADVPGAALVTSALMVGVYTIVKPAAEKGWGASETLILAAVAVALLVAFVVREHTAKSPLMPLRIFRSRNVTGANLVQALTVAGMFGMFFIGALYMQRVLSYDALETGLAFLPATLVMGVITLRLSEPLISRFGAKPLLFPGLALVVVGLVLFAQSPADANYWVDILPSMVLLSVGAASTFPALMGLAMSGVRPEEAGLASGLVNTSMQVGGALGLAVLATVSANHTETLAKQGKAAADALTSGYHVAFLVAAGLIALAVVVSLFVVEGEKASDAVPAPEGADTEPVAA